MDGKFKKIIYVLIIFTSLIFGVQIWPCCYGMELVTSNGKITFYSNEDSRQEGGKYDAHDTLLQDGMCATRGLSIHGNEIEDNSVIYIETTSSGEGSFANERYFIIRDTGGLASNQVDVFAGSDTAALNSAPYGTYRGAKIYLVEKNVSLEDYMAKYYNGSAADTSGVSGTRTINILELPKIALGYYKKSRNVSNKTIDKTIKEADTFVETGDTSVINQNDLSKIVKNLYYILLSVAVIIVVIIGTYLSIKTISSSAEGKAKIKELYKPYLIGCLVTFGAFGIWRLVIEIFNSMAN